MHGSAIVVGFDGTVGSHAALDAAVRLARATLAPLAVVHVEHQPPVVTASAAIGLGAGALVAAEESFADVLRQDCAEILDAADVRWFFEIRRGNPADELTRAADDCDATFIVVGRHGHQGLIRLLAGSVTRRLLERARHPLLIIPPPPPPA